MKVQNWSISLINKYLKEDMTNDELKVRITELVPDAAYDESGEWLNVKVAPSEFRKLSESLYEDKELNFDFMFCLTCVDWKDHLTMVYHLKSTTQDHTIVVKSDLNRDKPEIETICDIWRTAELLEREVAEMFGVTFINHPDPRKLLLWDDFKGFPLRKDFEDPINMIKL